PLQCTSDITPLSLHGRSSDLFDSRHPLHARPVTRSMCELTQTHLTMPDSWPGRCIRANSRLGPLTTHSGVRTFGARKVRWKALRSEEHTSELQSRFDLVCRLL